MLRFKRLATILMCGLMLIGLLAGCTSSDTSETPADVPGESQGETVVVGEAIEQIDMTVGFFVEDLANPFFAEVQAAAIEWCNARGIEIITLAGAGGPDIEGMVRAVEDFVERKVDVIVMSAIDPEATVGAIEKAYEAGIPVITHTEDAPNSKRLTYVAADQFAGGRKCAEWLVSKLGGNGKVAIIEGNPGEYANEARKDGFASIVREYPGIKIVAQLPGHWLRDEGMRVMEDILAANPELDAVMAMNDEMALGACVAAKQAGRLDDLIIVGYNGTEEALKEIYKGNLSATAVTYPSANATIALEWAVKVVRDGEMPPAEHIDSGLTVVDGQLLRFVYETLKDM